MKQMTAHHRHILTTALGTVLAGIVFVSNAAGQQLVEPNRGGEVDLKSVDPKVALEHLKPAEGYEVNLFASEKDFPLENPVAMAWDAKGRLWVATMPSYPQYLPGVPPNDQVIILEDTDWDGKADKHTVFADKLYLPAGLELGDGGVYVAQQPNLVFLKDTDGDDVADVRETILHGFGTEDSHHAISAFVWGPGGALYFQEGTFHHSQVETPYGPVRLENAGVFRFEPKTFKLEVFVSYGFANPWGHIFDRWGQNFVADASGGSNYFGTAFSGHVDYPRKHPRMKEFTTTKVRPTAGCEIVSSRHFPDEAQGNFLLNNCIGFQGVKQHQMIEEGSGFTTKEIEPLLQSSDINFRPVDIEFGPDGALYIVDWFNPLIGHMQYSLRDERRDHNHGRIWRITYKHKPLLKPAPIAGRPVPELLDLLKTYEDRVRYRVRTELRLYDSATIQAEVPKWIAGLDKSDPEYEHHLLEALWVYQAANVVEPKLLTRVLRSPNPHARAAATRVLCYQRNRVENALELLREQANDEHPRVRLEAVRACSFFTVPEAAEVALEAVKHETDYYIDYTLTETITTLEKYWKPAISAGRPFAADNPAGIAYILDQIPTPDLVKLTRSEPVFVALLSRPNVKQEYRLEALRELSKLHQTDELQELLAAIERLDRGTGNQSNPVLFDLARILTGREPSELTAARARFEQLASRGKRPVTRQIGYVAMITADQSVDRTWELALASAGSLRDLLDAVPMIPDVTLRGALYPRIEPLLHGLPEPLAEKVGNQRGTLGRYVRIELPGDRRTLTLAEVEVYRDGRNIARRGKASQSSTSHGGVAQRAVDGNTSGRYGDGGQTHTDGSGRNPWWELDLGSEQPIEAIHIWNRTESELGKRLQGFRLSVLDGKRQPVFVKADNPAPAENVRFALQADPAGVIRRAAINAVTFLPGHETEMFRTLSRYFQKGTERTAVVRALHRIPKQYWPKQDVAPLVNSIVEYAEKVPAKDRATPAVRDALQLGNDLAALLPAEQARKLRAAIGDLGVKVIMIRPVPHKMRYDKSVVAVQAGKPVEIVLDNTDIMPHNLIVTRPGHMLEVAQAAERMATQPDAFARQFIPESPHILHATKLLQSREVERLVFVAPSEVGEYPYVCTFPGHWRTMNGVMHVVADLDKYLEENPLPEPVEIAETRPFVRDWSFEDLVSELDQLDGGRSFTNGKKLFTEASCFTCHRMNELGGMVGPDLGKLEEKMTRVDILREILEPSKIIKDKYKAHIVVTDEGKQIIGMIQSQDDKVVRIMPNPLGMEKCEPVVIPVESIEFQKESQLSLMPEKLLNTLTKEEILDLLAYLEARGNPEHPVFQK